MRLPHSVAWLVLASLLTSSGLGAQGSRQYVESLKANTVFIEAAGMTGFGFIVGFSDAGLLLATARHTVDSPGVTEARVCFFDRDETCATAPIVYFADPVGSLSGLDLAILDAPYPDGLPWRPDAMDDGITPGESVWSIGRYRDWYIPPASGKIVKFDRDRGTVHYEDLELARGVSGAPIVTNAGIVAMHLKSAGQGKAAYGLDIQVIRDRVEQQLGGRWILLARQDCDIDESHRRLIVGRTFLVHFDPVRPAGGLEAMARLNCVGARTHPRPVWNAAEWDGEKITYRSGELRTARTLQTIFASHGRLDALLGRPEGDAEIWIR